MNKQKIEAIFKVITPKQDEDMAVEEFADGYNTCISDFKENIKNYLATLE